ncbi:hypothetical protein [Streptomyces prunicolor]|uniref:hypothetical protein n=1 Tax=Streptomyces prunicolor TaxID=67348 RepID=UPI00037C94AB|nr:hypothetical protein [Streptomyces prunicolor]
MNVASIIEEIELIAEIGEAGDVLDLSRRLVGQGDTAWAIDVRRAVTRDVLDRNVLRAVAGRIAAAARPTVDWGLFADQLADVEAGLRAALAADAAMAPAERRERSAQEWVAQQRFEERVSDYNGKVEFVNRERGRARNEVKAAAVRANTCTKCFQVPAASGECGC